MSRTIQRMQRWPKSAPRTYIMGQAPAITEMPWAWQMATAFGETLVPAFASDWCIHTRGIPTSAHCCTMALVTSGRFTITTPSSSITRAGIRSVTNHNVTIRDNHIDGMGTWGIFTSFSDDILIQGNTASHSKRRP